MSYIVLARKWRPQTFADLVGQQHIAVTLRNAMIQNRVAHAFLFTGSRGVGKTSTARIFAKALNCEHSIDHEPCNECETCREITEGRAMDVIEIDGASNRGINEIREVLEAVRYAPTRGRFKIYIIDEVHMLTTEAFNALLKTLEEPPSHVLFIFATTDPNKIPVTIISRCQRYDFKRIREEDLAAHLGKIAKAESIAFDDSALHLIARTARGGVRDALSAMDQIMAFSQPPITGERAAEVLGVASRETLLTLGEMVLKRDVAGALKCIEKVDHYGQSLSQFAFDVLELWRDVAVLAACPEASVELSLAEINLVKSWLPLVSAERIQRIFQAWYQMSETLPKSLSPRLVMEMATIRMCQIENVIPLDGILRKIDAISKALGAGNIAPDALSHIQEFLSKNGLNGLDEKKKFFRCDEIIAKHDVAPNSTQANDVAPNLVRVGEAAPNSMRANDVAPNLVRTNDAAPNLVRVSDVAPNLVRGNDVAPNSMRVGEVAPNSMRMGDAAPNLVRTNDTALNSVSEPPDDPFGLDWGMPPEAENHEIPVAWNEFADIESDEDCEESPINITQSIKELEISQNRPKSAALEMGGQSERTVWMQTWQRIVGQLAEPLATIMRSACIQSMDAHSVNATLPSEFQSLINAKHVQDVERVMGQVIGRGAQLKLRFDQIGSDSDSLAAQKIRAELEFQKNEAQRVLALPIMKTIIEVFGIQSEAIQFTINPDRIIHE